jgi:hypothetical protein
LIERRGARRLIHVAVQRTRIEDGLALDGLAPSNAPRELTAVEAGKAQQVLAFDTIPADQRGGASGQVICTLNARIQLTSTNAGLTNPATVADPFINKIHYTATASYNGAIETINTTTAAAGVATSGAVTTAGGKTNFPLDLAVNITPTPPNKYLANGTFSDTLVVTLSPMP